MTKLSAQRTTYRHGNVLNEAIERTWAIIEDQGPDKFSMRSLATDMGLTHRALYNHFEDKDALLRAVAATGFFKLALKLDTKSAPKDFAKAYIRFALSHAPIYQVMMRQKNAVIAHDEALYKAIGQVIKKAEAVFSDPHKTEIQNRRAIHRIWMLLHGGVSLHLTRTLMPLTDAAFMDEMMEILDA